MLCRPCSSFIAHPCLVMGLTWAPAPTCAGLTLCTVRRENGPTEKEENSTNLPASLSSSQPALLRQTSVKSYSRFSHKISFSGIQDIINILRYGIACQGRLKESHSLGGPTLLHLYLPSSGGVWMHATIRLVTLCGPPQLRRPSFGWLCMLGSHMPRLLNSCLRSVALKFATTATVLLQLRCGN
jgi:hypothetical protein